MKRVFIASPYTGDILRNEIYARDCMRDSFYRGEAPFVPHLLYTQILPRGGGKSHLKSLEATKAMLAGCELLALYRDFDVSLEMLGEMTFAMSLGIPWEFRTIPEYANPYPVLSGVNYNITIMSTGISSCGTEGSYGNLEGSTFKKGDVLDRWSGQWKPSDHPYALTALCDWPPEHLI